jgi:hypothetical protein
MAPAKRRLHAATFRKTRESCISSIRDWRCDALQPECGKAVTMSRNRMWCGASCAAGIILSASTGRWQIPGRFTKILTANLNYWREGLESKEETPCAEFRRGSRAGAAQSREGCGKDGADAWNTLVLLGKRKGRREETLAHRPS